MSKGLDMLRILIVLILCTTFNGRDLMALTLTSPTFTQGGDIPKEFTCEGGDQFPGLQWDGAPAGTACFVIICDDPDVPETLRSAVPDLVWDHLVIFNIPTNIKNIKQGAFECPKGGTCGTNSWGREDYGGPCPPNPKAHRYFFTLYALDTTLSLQGSARKKDVLKAIEGHVLDKTVLMGHYLKEEFKR